MKKIIYTLLILITFTSCYTLQKAQKQVDKAHFKFPIVTSGFCAETFPVKENVIEKTKFIKGKETFKTDTVTVDCDSVVADETIKNKVLIKYRNIFRTDTIFKDKIITKENTAKTKNLQLKIKEKEKVIAEKEQLITMLKYGLIALIIAVLLLIFIKR